MATQYEIRALDPFGVPIAILDRPISLSYTRTVNAVGKLTMQLARDAIPDAYIAADLRIEIWRRPDVGAMYLDGDGPWLLQAEDRITSKDGRYRVIEAEPLITLLGRRSAMYYANTAQTQKGPAPADDIMKAIFRDNLGSSAGASPIGGPTRDWTSTGLTVDNDVSGGPSTSKGFAWQSVLTTMQAISRDAASIGAPVYFDIVQTATGAYVFRTFVGVHGTDRTIGLTPLTVSAERGSLADATLSTDWTNMATTVIAGGQGQDSARVIGVVYDSARAALSTWGDREAFIDRTQLSTTATLQAEAYAELRRRRPQQVLSGTVVNIPGAVYGLDWGFGDKLYAEFEGQSFVARIDSVTVRLANGREDITAQIKSDAV
jgi:hypothetical protein